MWLTGRLLVGHEGGVSLGRHSGVELAWIPGRRQDHEWPCPAPAPFPPGSELAGLAPSLRGCWGAYSGS